MSRGKRYEEPKLNMKKVFAVIILFVVIIMCIVMLKGIFTKDEEQGNITSIDYFAAYKDNKWGVIDSNGNIVIDPSFGEMIIVPNSKEDVFLYTFDVNYDEGTYKTKAINSKNEGIFTNYEQVEAISSVDENQNLIDHILFVERKPSFSAPFIGFDFFKAIGLCLKYILIFSRNPIKFLNKSCKKTY